MLTRDELRSGCANLLKDLRTKHNISKSKMAGLIYVDDHTWNNYESGKTAISVFDFVYIFHVLGEDALKNVLDLIYPDIYADASPESSEEQLRKMAAHYIEHVATGRQIRQLNYSIFGKSGSNFDPRMQEMTMIEHLPLEYRIIIADLVEDLYDMAERKGTLVGTEYAMPDKKLMHEALERAKEAVANGASSYTTI